MIDRKEFQEQRINEDDNGKRETHDINREDRIEAESNLSEESKNHEAQIEENEARNTNFIALIPY